MAEEPESTRDRILRAFVRLVSERGYEATTTRAVAQAAGVNEVTIFRQFESKVNLARELFRVYGSPTLLSRLPLHIDTATPERTARSLVDHFMAMRSELQRNFDFVNFGLSEAWRYPDFAQEVTHSVTGGRESLERALDAARPMLRPEIDVAASAVSLHALMLMSVLWDIRGYLSHTEDEWKHIVESNIRVLVVDSSVDHLNDSSER